MSTYVSGWLIYRSTSLNAKVSSNNALLKWMKDSWWARSLQLGKADGVPTIIQQKLLPLPYLCSEGIGYLDLAKTPLRTPRRLQMLGSDHLRLRISCWRRFILVSLENLGLLSFKHQLIIHNICSGLYFVMMATNFSVGSVSYSHLCCKAILSQLGLGDPIHSWIQIATLS